MKPSSPPAAPWTFLTNHAHVLLCLARAPGLTLREAAEQVGITERSVHRIIADLEEAGYLKRVRSGRNNIYQIDPALPLRHPVERHQAVKSLLALVRPESSRKRK